MKTTLSTQATNMIKSVVHAPDTSKSWSYHLGHTSNGEIAPNGLGAIRFPTHIGKVA